MKKYIGLGIINLLLLAILPPIGILTTLASVVMVTAGKIIPAIKQYFSDVHTIAKNSQSKEP